MFKIGLLTSTAITAVTLLLSGSLQSAYAQTDMHAASRDPNTRFLCTYGAFLVNFGWGGSSSYFDSAWRHVAVSVTGHGQTVSRIRVIEIPLYSGLTSSFSAGIYSNSPSGFPGKLIAGGTGLAGPSCGPVTIPIAPTRLKRHTTYWIEETIPARYHGTSSLASVYWVANPYAKRPAYVQTHRYTACSSHATSCHSSSTTSPWMKQTKGPYVKLR